MSKGYERLCASLGRDRPCGEVVEPTRRGRRSYGHLALRAWGWWRSVTVPVQIETSHGVMEPESRFRGSLE